MSHQEEINVLRAIVQNMYEKMNINISHYERDFKMGSPDFEELNRFLHSCNEINMGRINQCLGRIKDLNK